MLLVEETATRETRKEEAASLAERSSLSTYTSLNLVPTDGVPLYLDDRINIHGTRLKTKLRLGAAYLMPKLAAALNWPSVAGACLLCCTGQLETVRHLLQCPALQHIRDRYRAELGARLLAAGDPGKEILRVFDTGGENSQARLTLGGTLDFDGPLCDSEMCT